MPYTTNVAGTGITAAWGNANVRDQVVSQFASVAARDTAITAPLEGMVCAVTGTDRLYAYTGSEWRVIGWWSAATGRPGVGLTDSAQTITSGTSTYIDWGASVWDVDGWFAGGEPAVVPAGWGGLYTVTAVVQWSSTSLGTDTGIAIYRNGTLDCEDNGKVVFGSHSIATQLVLAAGDTVRLRVFHNAGVDRTATSRMYIVPHMI